MPPETSHFKTAFATLQTLESLSKRDTFAHRLPASFKIVATLGYIIIVVSFPAYSFTALIPFLADPLILTTIAHIPWKLLWMRTALALPFVACAGLANLVIDRVIITTVWDIGISGGVISFAVLILKTLLTVSSVLILAGTTPLDSLAAGLRRLHVPCVLVVQFVLTWRYLEMLMTEAAHTWRAYRLRAANGKFVRFKDWPPLAGHLFLRGFDRAQRIYQAMQCRGFNVEFVVPEERKTTLLQYLALLGFFSVCIFLRCFNLPQWAGGLLS